MKNDFGGLLVTGGDVTYVPHQNWRSDTLKIYSPPPDSSTYILTSKIDQVGSLLPIAYCLKDLDLA